MPVMVTAASAPIWGAGVAGAFGLGAAKLQTRASGRAAKAQTNSVSEAARISGISAQNQLDFLREQADNQAYADEAAQRGNFGLSKAEIRNNFAQYVSGLRQNYNMSGDTAFNDRSNEVSRGRTNVDVVNADAFNTRSLGLADRRNANARDVVGQRRLGALGELIGQGPREIAAYADPAALREAQYFEPNPLQRTALELPPEPEIPDYISGKRPPNNA